MILPDVLRENLEVVFVGTAPSNTSVKVGAPYGNPQNKFYWTLHEVGLMPKPVNPRDFQTLVKYGIGFTDVCKTHHGIDSKLPREGFNPAGLWRKLWKFQPWRVAFTSLRAAHEGLWGAPIDYYGEVGTLLETLHIWVLPSTSPAANLSWSIEPWMELGLDVIRHRSLLEDNTRIRKGISTKKAGLPRPEVSTHQAYPSVAQKSAPTEGVP